MNVLSPGTIDTGIFASAPTELKDQFVSDDSSFVTGIELFVDGGAAQI